MKKNLLVLALIVGFIGQRLDATLVASSIGLTVEQITQAKDALISQIASLLKDNNIDQVMIDNFSNDFYAQLNMTEFSVDSIEKATQQVINKYPEISKKQFYKMKYVKKNGLKSGGSVWSYLGYGAAAIAATSAATAALFFGGLKLVFSDCNDGNCLE